MLIIDRFEENFAIIEVDGNKTENIPKNLLPVTAREGDVIYKDGESYKIDGVETQKRREAIIAKMRKLGL